MFEGVFVFQLRRPRKNEYRLDDFKWVSGFWVFKEAGYSCGILDKKRAAPEPLLVGIKVCAELYFFVVALNLIKIRKTWKKSCFFWVPQERQPYKNRMKNILFSEKILILVSVRLLKSENEYACLRNVCRHNTAY